VPLFGSHFLEKLPVSALFVLLISLLFLTSTCVAAQWRDEFDEEGLHDRWTWHVPVPGPTISLTDRPGWLRMIVPQTARGFNHWVNEQRAALLRTPAPDGDWDLGARITLSDWKPDSNLHLALMVEYPRDKVLAWGSFLSKAIYPETSKPTVWAEPTGQGSYIRTDVEPTDVELQISKRRDTYHLRHRRAGDAKWGHAGGFYAGDMEPEFVGLMGKSFGRNPAGTLDVDYIELTPVDPEAPAEPFAARISIGAPTGKRVPALQRGFFLEHLGHCIFQGIWDERLHNRKFIGPDTATGVAWRWAPVGEAKGYALDRAQPYAEPQSQRIDLAEAEGGIAQRGLAIEEGRKYALRVVVKTEGDARSVRVSLGDGQGTQTDHSFRIDATEWQTHTCELTASHDVRDGSFSVRANGPGRLWIGAVSLMPADNVKGFRRDVLDITRRAKPPTFRWPGGNMVSGYYWRDGIGPRDRRPMRWDRAWKAWVYNDMGTDEYLEYCRLLGAEPCICVNAGEGRPDEAAAWVEYCNGSADTPMGQLRAANGHPEPYHVKYWDIGNEIWGHWQLGHVPPEQYGLRAVEFARAMRRVDPDLVLIASGVLARDFGDWNRKMLRICGPWVDMLSVHDYTRYDAAQLTDATWARVVGAPLRLERRLRATVELAEQAAGKRLPLTFDEWNSVPDKGRGGHGQIDALYAAGLFHAMQRLGDDLPIANLALLTNVLGAIRTNQTQAYETPTFLAFRLFAEHAGRWDVKAEAACPSLQKLPALDVAATLSEDKSTLHVTIINRNPRSDAVPEWQLGQFTPRGQVRVTTLRAPDPWARNTFERPGLVSLSADTMPWDEATRRPLPRASVTGFFVLLR